MAPETVGSPGQDRVTDSAATERYGVPDDAEATEHLRTQLIAITEAERKALNDAAGDTVTVYVRREDVPWFERRFGDDDQPATSTYGRSEDGHQDAH